MAGCDSGPYPLREDTLRRAAVPSIEVRVCRCACRLRVVCVAIIGYAVIKGQDRPIIARGIYVVDPRRLIPSVYMLYSLLSTLSILLGRRFYTSLE